MLQINWEGKDRFRATWQKPAWFVSQQFWCL